MQTVIYIAIMAGVTYLIRMLPIMVFRRKIKSQVVQSFLYYVPYAVLGAMTIPAVFYSTGSMAASAAGFAAGAAGAASGSPRASTCASSACAAALVSSVTASTSA